MRGALPVGENLQARKINADAKCPFCGAEETTLHLFSSCVFATQVWNLAPFTTQIPRDQIGSFKDLVEKSSLLQSLPPCGLGFGPLHPWIIWSIWLARNNKIFNDRSSSPREVITQAVSLAKEWQSAQSTIPPCPIQSSKAPRDDDPTATACHTDAAWNAEHSLAGCGWIFHNRRDGSRMTGSINSPHIRSPLLAEATAMYYALQHASDLGFSNLFFASDSKQLIEAINSETPTKELHGILFDILKIATSFRRCRFSFTPREQNREADALAKRSLTSLVPNPV